MAEDTLEEEAFAEAASAEEVSITIALVPIIPVPTLTVLSEAAGGGHGGVAPGPATTMEALATTRTKWSGAAPASGSAWWSPW